MEAAPELEHITGTVAYELEQAFKDEGIQVESFDDLGDVEFTFPDGSKFQLSICALSDDED